jgi:hypothetical protein
MSGSLLGSSSGFGGYSCPSSVSAGSGIGLSCTLGTSWLSALGITMIGSMEAFSSTSTIVLLKKSYNKLAIHLVLIHFEQILELEVSI